MEPEGSLLYSKVPTTCLYPELKVSVLVQGLLYECVVTREIFMVSFSTLPNPQAGGPPIVCCMRLLIQYVHSYPPCWRTFLHPQPEDALRCGDRDPLMTDDHIIVGNVVQL